MCARWRPIRDQAGTASPRSNRRNLAHQRNPHGFTNEISKYVKKKSRNSGAQGGTVGFIRIPGFRHPDLVRGVEERGGGSRGGGGAVVTRRGKGGESQQALYGPPHSLCSINYKKLHFYHLI